MSGPSGMARRDCELSARPSGIPALHAALRLASAALLLAIDAALLRTVAALLLAVGAALLGAIGA